MGAAMSGIDIPIVDKDRYISRKHCIIIGGEKYGSEFYIIDGAVLMALI